MIVKVVALMPVTKEIEVDDDIVDKYLHCEDEYDAAIEKKFETGEPYDSRPIIERMDKARHAFWDALNKGVDHHTICSYEVGDEYVEV